MFRRFAALVLVVAAAVLALTPASASTADNVLASRELQSFGGCSENSQYDIDSLCCDECFALDGKTKADCDSISNGCVRENVAGSLTCSCIYLLPYTTLVVIYAVVFVVYVGVGFCLAFFLLRTLRAKEMGVPEHERVVNSTATVVVLALTCCLGCFGVLIAYLIYDQKIRQNMNTRMFMAYQQQQFQQQHQQQVGMAKLGP